MGIKIYLLALLFPILCYSQVQDRTVRMTDIGAVPVKYETGATDSIKVAAALSKIGSADYRLVLQGNDTITTGNTVIPSNVVLDFTTPGSFLSVGVGRTTVIKGTVIAPEGVAIFDTLGTVNLDSAKIFNLSPTMYGAKNDSSNAVATTKAFQLANNAAKNSGKELYLPVGSYLLNSVTMDSTVNLKGAGVGTKIAVATGYTLTIKGSFENLVFDTTGTINLNDCKVTEFKPEMFASYSTFNSNAVPALRKLFASLPQKGIYKTGTISFQNGRTYKFAEPFLINSYSKIHLTGGGVIQSTITDTSNMIDVTSDNVELAMSNLEVIGNATTARGVSSDSTVGYMWGTFSNILVRGFTSPQSYGFYSHTDYRIQMTNCTFRENTRGAYIEGTIYGNSIVGSNFFYNTAYQIELIDCAFEFSGNNVTDDYTVGTTSGYNMRVADSFGNISGNMFDGAYTTPPHLLVLDRKISTYGNDGITIHGNKFEYNAGYLGTGRYQIYIKKASSGINIAGNKLLQRSTESPVAIDSVESARIYNINFGTNFWTRSGSTPPPVKVIDSTATNLFILDPRLVDSENYIMKRTYEGYKESGIYENDNGISVGNQNPIFGLNFTDANNRKSGFVFTNTTYNKNISTFAQIIDTAAMSMWWSVDGTANLKITDDRGITYFFADSTGKLYSQYMDVAAGSNGYRIAGSDFITSLRDIINADSINARIFNADKFEFTNGYRFEYGTNAVYLLNAAGSSRYKFADTGLEFLGTQVITQRQAAVPDATGGSTVDAEARAAINALLARLRTHGLITP